ncbi:MAG: hypothetical protein Q7R95_02230 [bacterium]|nr:hypothetical protein [bacterium]
MATSATLDCDAKSYCSFGEGTNEAIQCEASVEGGAEVGKYSVVDQVENSRDAFKRHWKAIYLSKTTIVDDMRTYNPVDTRKDHNKTILSCNKFLRIKKVKQNVYDYRAAQRLK